MTVDQRSIYTRTRPFTVVFRRDVKQGEKLYFKKGRGAGKAKIGEPAPKDWDEVWFSSKDRWVWPKAGQNP